MFSSRIHFRTNTFDILSHLANRQTTDGRNIHACATVDLFSYTHCRFLSKVRILLDFRFSLKCVYLFCKFQECEKLEYIFQDISLRIKMANSERLEIRCRKQIFLPLLPQNILRIFKHLPKWRSLYMRETLYRHCKFSANFRFRKMFYPQNFVV